MGSSARSGSSTEHSCIKLKRLRSVKGDLRKVRMSRIQQNIPIPSNGCGRDKESHAVSGPDPIVTKAAQRFVSRAIPDSWQCVELKPLNPERIRDFAFDKYQIAWPQVRFKINEDFDRSKRK